MLADSAVAAVERGEIVTLLGANGDPRRARAAMRTTLELASRGYVLDTGRIVTEGSSAQLLADDDVRKAYLRF